MNPLTLEEGRANVDLLICVGRSCLGDWKGKRIEIWIVSVFGERAQPLCKWFHPTGRGMQINTHRHTYAHAHTLTTYTDQLM